MPVIFLEPFRRTGRAAALTYDPLQKRGQWPETIKGIGPQAKETKREMGIDKLRTD